MMKSICFVVVSAVMAGCANVNPPIDVTLIPNDCANQARIIRWLESQSQLTPVGADKVEYDRYRQTVKSRIWNLRYNCNPV